MTELLFMCDMCRGEELQRKSQTQFEDLERCFYFIVVLRITFCFLVVSKS